MKCRDCNGLGSLGGPSSVNIVSCPACKGSGVVAETCLSPDIRLSPAAFERLTDIMENPPPPSPALRALFRRADCVDPIGGYDIVLQGRPTLDDAMHLWRALRELWPQGVYHDIDSTVPLSFNLASVSWCSREFAVYRDLAAFEAWRDSGATDENSGDMVQVIVGESAITIVVDAAGSPLEKAVSRIVQGMVAESH